MVILLLAALTLATMTGLVIAQYRQFTWGKMALRDYGIYFNMLWNTAHGDWFRYLTNQNYLSTHLSFSLTLIAPLFLLWDDPITLTVIQWVCLAVGALLFWRILALSRIPPLPASALLLLFVGYPYVQRSMLSEFHGVHLYYVLIPWLYLCLAFRKSWVWIPLLLTAGLREDAVFTILPMLLYFAAADQWKVGYLWSAAAAAYGILALTMLFPWINGITIDQRRDILLNPEAIRNSLSHQILKRLLSSFRLFLPALPLLFRKHGWIPVITFPLLILIILLASPERHHYCIDRHYSAGIFTCVLLGMVEALRRTEFYTEPRTASRRAWLFSGFLVSVIMISHLSWGCLPWANASAREVFRKTSPYVPLMLHTARHLPREGVLMTDGAMAGYLANRRSLTTFKNHKTDPIPPDYVFFDAKAIKPPQMEVLRSLITAHSLGVVTVEPPFVIMKAGADPGRNAEVLGMSAYPAGETQDTSP